jgi:hypothetical protein
MHGDTDMVHQNHSVLMAAWEFSWVTEASTKY